MCMAIKMNIQSAITVVVGIVLFLAAVVALLPTFLNSTAEMALQDVPFASFFATGGVVILMFMAAIILLIVGALGLGGRGKR